MFKDIDESETLERSPTYLVVMPNYLFSITELGRHSKYIWVGSSWALYDKLAMVVVGIRKDGESK